MKKYFTLIIFFSLSEILAVAQRNNIFDFSSIHPQVINPSYCVSEGSAQIILSGQKQWLGMNNAPTTQIMSFNGKLQLLKPSSRKDFIQQKKYKYFGFGGILFHDKNGIENRTSAILNYAYQFQLYKKLKVALALGAGFDQLNINQSDFSAVNSNDPLISGADENYFFPKVNFGGSIYSPNKYAFEMAFCSIYQNKKASTTLNSTIESTHFITSVTYTINVFSNFKFIPKIILRVPVQEKVLMEASLTLANPKKYFVTFHFRNHESMQFIGGINITHFTFGYSYEYNYSAIRLSSYGTHGIFILIKI